jgi:hypothetical protein
LIGALKEVENPKRRIVFITAMTRAAIKACLKKLRNLLECYRGVSGLDWLKDVKEEHVKMGMSITYLLTMLAMSISIPVPFIRFVSTIR